MERISYVVRMGRTSFPLREPVLRSAVRTLGPSPSSSALDVGCGLGEATVLLTEAVGKAGRVTGVDISGQMLALAEADAAQAGLSDRVSYRQADARSLPFPDDAFDWAWSVDCVGYAPTDPRPPLREMARVVRPGGRVILMSWSSETLLPGHPLLEARLKASRAGLAPFSPHAPPERHFLRALAWFRRLGLVRPAACAFAGSAHAPLDRPMREALAALFAMRWPGVEQELSAQDRDAYRRLCLPASPDFILDHPDYCAIFTYTAFHGIVP